MKWTKKVASLFKKAIFGIFALIFLLTFTLRGQSEQVPSTDSIPVKSRASLVHLASVDSLEITEGGTQAATLMLDALENNNLESARKAIALYDRLIPKENFGGDYTALQWFAQYFIASPEAQKQLLSDKYVANYFQMLAEDNFSALKEYIQRKYKLTEFSDRFSESGRNREAFLEDFIRFNSPRREDWEKSSKIVQALNLKKGDRVADIGSGPGYYSFKFAQLVGDKGQVFAIDTVQNHLDYIGRVQQKNSIGNITLVHTDGDTIGLTDNQVDVAFMCSLYHIIYTVSKEDEQDQFINSIKNALKPNGTLVIVDNALIEGSDLPYQGPYMIEELITAQLKYYGFHLVKTQQFIPQRYVLMFQKQ